MARHVTISYGRATCGQPSCLQPPVKTTGMRAQPLVYPILYNYRHAVELALKWIIMKFGNYASVEVGDYEHHNLWKLWCVYKEIVLELGSDDGNTLEVVEQVMKDLHDLDGSGQAFRYADAKHGTFKLPEDAIDLRNTREVMKGVDHFFTGVYGQLDDNVSAAGPHEPWGLVTSARSMTMYRSQHGKTGRRRSACQGAMSMRSPQGSRFHSDGELE